MPRGGHIFREMSSARARFNIPLDNVDWMSNVSLVKIWLVPCNVMILITFGRTLVYLINPNPHCQIELMVLQEKVASLIYGKIIIAFY